MIRCASGSALLKKPNRARRSSAAKDELLRFMLTQIVHCSFSVASLIVAESTEPRNTSSGLTESPRAAGQHVTRFTTHSSISTGTSAQRSNAAASSINCCTVKIRPPA